MCNQTSEKMRHFKDFKDAFIKLSYEHELLDYRFEKTMRVDRKALLQTTKKQATQEYLRYQISKNVTNKHWHFLFMKN